MEQQILTVHAELAGQARTETLMGRSYRVVPAVLVRAQVLRNNLGATFLPPDAISAGWADVWNSIPVIAGSHPMFRGTAMSARTPSLLNARGVGFIFAAESASDGPAGRKLRGEVWLDEARATAVPDLQAILERLDAGEPVELSTGFPTLVDEVVGVHNGQQYTQVLRPTGADHLAIFAAGVGACSVSDGCGLGVNHGGACAPLPSTMEDAHVDKTDEGTGTVTPPAPVEAGNAEKGPEEKRGVLHRAVSSVLKALGMGTAANVEGLPDEEKRRLLERALQAQLAPTPQAEALVTAVFSDQGVVVFWWSTPQGAVPPGDVFLQVGFSIDSRGGVTFGGVPIQVRRKVSFDPVTVAGNQEPDAGSAAPHLHEEDPMMDRTALIAALALVGPLDAENLAKLSDCQLKALRGIDAVNADGAEAPEKDAAAGEAAAAEAAHRKAELEEVKTALAAVHTKLAELASVTAPVVAEQERERTELLAQLSANARVAGVYAKEELEAMSTEALRKTASLSRGESYAGRGGPKAEVANAEPTYMEPVPYWEKPTDRKEVTV